MGTTSTIKRRRNQRRRRRRRNKNGGIIRPSDTENEAVLVNERKETDSQCAKEDRSNVAGNRNSIQTRSQSANMCEKQKCKKETVSSKTSGDKTEGNNTFRYDKLFKFGSGKRKEDNGHMSGTSSAAEEASDNVNTTRKDATFRYDRLFNFRKRRYSGGNSESNVPSASTARNEHKENMPLPADKEFATDRHTANKTAKDCFFKYDRLFTFSSKKHAEVGANSHVDRTNMKAEQNEGSMQSPKEKEPTSCHGKTADSFRYDRLFNFSKKSSKVQNGSPDENDDLSASSKVGDAKKKETVHQCTDQEFNTNRDKTNKAEKKNSSFSTRKQNFADNTDGEVYMTHNSMDDSDEYDYEIRSEGSDNENIDINEFYRGMLFPQFASEFPYSSNIYDSVRELVGCSLHLSRAQKFHCSEEQKSILASARCQDSEPQYIVFPFYLTHSNLRHKRQYSQMVHTVTRPFCQVVSLT